MKNLVSFLVLVFLFGIQSYSIACSCAGSQSFCETVNPDSSSLLIVRGKKKAQIEHGMDFEISSIYNGDESKKTIRVWGDPGHLCRVYTSNFENGEELILALIEITWDESAGSCCESEKKGDYILSVCGVYYVRASDEVGMAAAAECLGEEGIFIPGSSEDTCSFKVLKYYPNPTPDFVSINTSVDLKNHIGNLQIVDLKGQVVFEYSDFRSIYNNGEIRLNLSDLQKGLYIFKLEIPEICPDPRIGKIVVN